MCVDFPVTPYGGTKSIVISTVAWIGGKNPFMGWAYVATAILFVVLGLAGTVRHLLSPRCVPLRSALFVRVLITGDVIENSGICHYCRGINPARALHPVGDDPVFSVRGCGWYFAMKEVVCGWLWRWMGLGVCLTVSLSADDTYDDALVVYRTFLCLICSLVLIIIFLYISVSLLAP